MGLSISGQAKVIQARSSVNASDTAYPSGSSQSGSIAVPQNAKGARTHILIDITSGGSPSVIAHLFGYVSDTSTWYWLDTINNGVAIDQSLSNVDDGNNLHFAEVLDHVSTYDRLYVALTSLTGVATITFIFEQLHRGQG